MKIKLSKRWLFFGLILILGVSVLWLLFETGFGAGSADCIWTGNAVAWIDENRNGIKDAGEIPLPNVQFLVDDMHNEYTNVASEVVTDKDGKAILFVWLPGCPRVKMEVYPIVPQGYELTTSPRLKNTKDKLYEFGFVYLAGISTETPNP